MSRRAVVILAGFAGLAALASLCMVVTFAVFPPELRGCAGFGYADLPQSKVADFPKTNGILVREIVPGSPADLAGLRVGDLIVAVDEQPTPSMDKFEEFSARWRTGLKVRLDFVRPAADSSTELKRSTINLVLISAEEFGPLLEKSTPAN